MLQFVTPSVMILLTWPIFWFVCIAFVLVEALLIASALRLRRAAAADADAAKPATGRFNLFWTLLPALLMLVLFVLVYQALTGASQVLL